MIGAHLSIGTSDGGPERADAAVELSLEPQVQHGLNLFLPLKSPGQMRALLETIAAVKKDAIDPALERLHYVHFARFVPAPDSSALWVITTFDGPLEPYIMDFVEALGDVFTQALQFILGAPPLPVKQYAREFVEFVVAHNITAGGDVWSAYRDMTVIDIQRQGARA
jgi:hypothetical protein